MNYEWDPKKNRRNLKVHGIRFEDAIGIFDGITLERVDDRFDYGETRVYAIGVVNGTEVVVIYVDIDVNRRRIVSTRRAERHERKAYWENIR